MVKKDYTTPYSDGETTYDKVIKKMDKITSDLKVLNILTSIFGYGLCILSFLACGYMMSYSILGGF